MGQNICYVLASLAVWLCLKMGSANMVLVRLLQIGAKDLTVCSLRLQPPHLTTNKTVFKHRTLLCLHYVSKKCAHLRRMSKKNFSKDNNLAYMFFKKCVIYFTKEKRNLLTFQFCFLDSKICFFRGHVSLPPSVWKHCFHVFLKKLLFESFFLPLFWPGTLFKI